MYRPILAVLASLALLLAGCSDASVEDPDDIILGEPGLGSVAGIVADAALNPLEGVTVTLMADEREAATDSEGAFTFSNVEPGTHFLKAHKLGYHEVQQSLEVEADARAPLVKILMEVDAETRPHVQELVFDGFIECSTTYVALCAVPDTVTDLLGQPPLTNDQFIVYHELDETDPDWVQSEMVWDSTQELSDRLWLWHSFAKQDEFQGSFGHQTGTSPLLMTTSSADIEGVADNSTTFDPDDWQLVVRVFSGDIEGTTPPMCVLFCNGPGFAVNQQFKVFTHVFHNHLPPEGWRFTEDGSVPVPE